MNIRRLNHEIRLQRYTFYLYINSFCGLNKVNENAIVCNLIHFV